MLRHYEQQQSHSQWNAAMAILSLPALHFQMCDIRPRAILPPLVKCQKSTINIFCESDIVHARVLSLPKAGGEHGIPQPKASGDHHSPEWQKATFALAKRLIEVIVFTESPWPIVSDEKYSTVDEAWQLAIEAQDRQWAFADVPVGTPSVCQLPSGPSLEINPQTLEGASIYSVFCSSIELMMIQNPKNIQSDN